MTDKEIVTEIAKNFGLKYNAVVTADSTRQYAEQLRRHAHEAENAAWLCDINHAGMEFVENFERRADWLLMGYAALYLLKSRLYGKTVIGNREIPQDKIDDGLQASRLYAASQTPVFDQEGDGLNLCEVCGDAYTRGRLCRSCAEQKAIDES